MTSFQEKYGPWALITGASSGIGAEFAKQLAERSLNLVLIARRKERLEHLAGYLEKKYNVQVETIIADLSRPDFMSLVYPVIQTREIGLLVNNAGFGIGGNFLEHDLQRELALLDVNCRAPLILAHEIGRQMTGRRRGGIIFVSSVSAYMATPFEASYAASKVYDLFLGESLWYELKQQGVDVLSLCPGSTMTEFHEVAGTREVAAMAVEPVVALALKKLGKKPSVIAGWHNRLLVSLTKMIPRRIMTIFAGKVMDNLRRPS